MKTEFFLAMRYLRPRRNAVSIITLISIVGVLLGVAVLIVVLAVMTGFTDIMKSKLIQTQAHLQISGGRYALSDVPAVQAGLMAAGAVRTAAVITHPALLQRGTNFEPKLVFGVEPAEVREVMDIDGALRPGGRFDLEPGEAVVGSRLASRFNLEPGDKLILHSPAKLAEMVKVNASGQVTAAQGNTVFLPSEFTVTGVVSFGKYDFDRDVIFLNRTDAADLFKLRWGDATAVYAWVRDPFKMDGTLAALHQSFPAPFYRVESWQTLNAQLLGVLAVEKNMMFFLLIFIVLVAAFSIANTLITSVCQKTREIGVLKALGGSDWQVMNVFVLQGFLVGVIGSSLGTLLGVLVIHYRLAILKAVSGITGQPLFPAELYYFNELPAHIVPGDVAIVVISAVVLCTAGGIIPALRAARLAPAAALRYE